MKVAITGHSKHIGKALDELFISQGHATVGFSRSNGYDISDPQSIASIVNQSTDCDVFVNNAWSDFYQNNLFEEMFTVWQHQPSKTIVNISSRAKYWSAPSTDLNMYYMSKKQLNHSAYKKMFEKNRCKVITINPGYVSDNSDHSDRPTITTAQLAETINWCLTQPPGVEIGELSVWQLGF
jgi:NAD(P)-dependent dehydrogenase (short-subunit alcohol dehydrogenase family)